MAEHEAVLIPRAIYRLQPRKGFGFGHAAALAPDFARLCISHAYASACLKGAARRHTIAAPTSASSRGQRHFQFAGPAFATAINRLETAQVKEGSSTTRWGLQRVTPPAELGSLPAIDQLEVAIGHLMRSSAEG